MEATREFIPTAERSRAGGAVWTGRVITGLVVLSMLFDAITKIVQIDAVVKASANLGYDAGSIQVIGMILLVCTVIYAVPRTSILGAVLLTGYLGGAVASNLRVGTPLFSNTLFPVYFGILVWAGIYLRDRRVSILFSSNKEK